MFTLNVSNNMSFLSCTIWTVRADERFFASVSPKVSPHVLLLGSSVEAEDAGKASC